MDAIEFIADRAQLTLLELAHREAAPAVGRADDGRIHELQHGALPESVRDDLRAPALLEKEPLEQICGANHPAMAEWEAEMSDAGVEVIAEALHHCGQLPLVGGHEVVAQYGRESGRRCLVAPARPQCDLGPLALLRRLRIRWTRHRWRSARGKQVSTARIRPGAPSVTASSGSAKPRRLRSSKNAVQLAVSSFVPGARCSRTLRPSSVIPQAQSTASRGSPACRRSATPSTKK